MSKNIMTIPVPLTGIIPTTIITTIIRTGRLVIECSSDITTPHITRSVGASITILSGMTVGTMQGIRGTIRITRFTFISDGLRGDIGTTHPIDGMAVIICILGDRGITGVITQHILSTRAMHIEKDTERREHSVQQEDIPAMVRIDCHRQDEPRVIEQA